MNHAKQIDKNTIANLSDAQLVDLVQSVKAGHATKQEAYGLAIDLFAFIGHPIRSINLGLVESMSRAEVDDLLDNVEGAKQLARDAEGMFEHYPQAAMIAKTIADSVFYAEAALAPALILGCDKDARDKASRTSTYIIKNPSSGLIKIGKTVDIKTRLQTLMCGAGVMLEILVVIPADIERELHQKFSHLRVRGEWFDDPESEIYAHAKSIDGASFFKEGA